MKERSLERGWQWRVSKEWQLAGQWSERGLRALRDKVSAAVPSTVQGPEGGRAALPAVSPFDPSLASRHSPRSLFRCVQRPRRLPPPSSAGNKLPGLHPFSLNATVSLTSWGPWGEGWEETYRTPTCGDFTRRCLSN